MMKRFKVQAVDVLTLAVIVLVVLNMMVQCGDPHWKPAPHPVKSLQSGVQPSGDPGVQQGRQPASRCAYGAWRACPQEDGIPGGAACLWTDPETGNLYLITGEEDGVD